jgi:hypothetical protein
MVGEERKMNMRPVAVVLGLGPLMALAVVGSPQEPKVDSGAGKILDRVAQAYAGCRTYRDTGVVRTVFIKGEQRRTTERRFRTAFVRPDRFRFEFSERTCCEDQGRYIISMNGPEILTWWEIKPGVEKPPSLVEALGAAAGVSAGSSRSIPGLLLPDELRGGRLTAMKDTALLPDADLDGVRCLRVEGGWGKDRLILWIDSDTYLVRRIDLGHTFDDFRTETTTLYEPTIDQEIGEDALAFGAPLAKAAPSKAATRP